MRLTFLAEGGAKVVAMGLIPKVRGVIRTGKRNKEKRLNKMGNKQ